MTEEESVKRKVKQVEGDINEAENVRNGVNKGAWTAEEDQKLAEVIAIHGAKRWKLIAAKAGDFTPLFPLQYSNSRSKAKIMLNGIFF